MSHKFEVEYAKSARAEKKCKAKIEKDAVRVGHSQVKNGADTRRENSQILFESCWDHE